MAAVSTKERQQDPENQVRALRAHHERAGWDVADVLVFKQSRWDDESAAEVRAAVMERVARGDVDVASVWAWDRISRRGIEEAFAFLRELEGHHRAAFFSLQEPFLSTAGDKEHREVMLALISWAAKWDSERKSRRLTAKAETKRSASAKLGQRATWGKGKLATPAEVERIRALRAEGRSVRDIATETGIPKSQVDRILRGEVKSA